MACSRLLAKVAYRANQLLTGMDFFDHVLSRKQFSTKEKTRETKFGRSMNTETKLDLRFLAQIGFQPTPCVKAISQYSNAYKCGVSKIKSTRTTTPPSRIILECFSGVSTIWLPIHGRKPKKQKELQKIKAALPNHFHFSLLRFSNS